MSQICETLRCRCRSVYVPRKPRDQQNRRTREGRTLGEIYAIDADLDHNYGYPKYPEIRDALPGRHGRTSSRVT